MEHHPAHRKVVGSIPDEGTYLGSGFDPCLGLHGRQPIDVSLPLHSSLSKINRHILEQGLNK